MKFGCQCGRTIYDILDGVSYKAHCIRDRDWNALWNAIDDAVEKSGPTAQEKEAACVGLRVPHLSLAMFQCPYCGRVHIFKRMSIPAFRSPVASSTRSGRSLHLF
jgi:hypothetical protein